MSSSTLNSMPEFLRVATSIRCGAPIIHLQGWPLKSYLVSVRQASYIHPCQRKRNHAFTNLVECADPGSGLQEAPSPIRRRPEGRPARRSTRSSVSSAKAIGSVRPRSADLQTCHSRTAMRAKVPASCPSLVRPDSGLRVPSFVAGRTDWAERPRPGGHRP